jgi:nicotinate-nucleotide--dimethylbenzimidazole phosphoribosyltransferase
MQQLSDLCRRIGPLDTDAMRATQERLDRLTKPLGSLGRLEELAVTVSGITGRSDARLPRKAVIVAAGDHGVAAEGVSAYPQAVTAQMVLNFLAGGAAINVLARRAGARVVVADLGVATDLPEHPALVRRKIGYGTHNMASEPAMRAGEAAASIRAGVAIVETEIENGLDVVAIGEMGIANTTAASAIVAALTGAAVSAVTGRGTGISDEQWRRKVAVIEQTLTLHGPDPTDALDVLTKVGGYEIGGLVGVILGAAAHRVVVIVDGFIAGAAALLACAYCPAVRPYLIAAHSSVEIGHRVALEHLGLAPLLDLNLRLGEGTGAVMAMHLLDDAAAVLTEMATFSEAGVSEQVPT